MDARITSFIKRALKASLFADPSSYGLSFDELALLGEAEEVFRGELDDTLRLGEYAGVERGEDGLYRLEFLLVQLDLLQFDIGPLDDDPREVAAFEAVWSLFSERERREGQGKAREQEEEVVLVGKNAGATELGVRVAIEIYVLANMLVRKDGELVGRGFSRTMSPREGARRGPRMGRSLNEGVKAMIPRVRSLGRSVNRGGQESETVSERGERRSMTKKRRVFVVHGRDAHAKDALVNFLQDVGLDSIEWEEVVREANLGGSPSTLDIVRAGLSTADAVVVLLTPDEDCRLRSTLAGKDEDAWRLQPRPNVIFEAGAAMAMDQRRVVLVESGMTHGISDIDGLNTIRMYEHPKSLAQLRSRLGSAGLDVKDDGERWLEPGRTAGLFRAPPPAHEGEGAEGGSELSELGRQIVSLDGDEESKVSLLVDALPIDGGFKVFSAMDQETGVPAGTWKAWGVAAARKAQRLESETPSGMTLTPFRIAKRRRRR